MTRLYENGVVMAIEVLDLTVCGQFIVVKALREIGERKSKIWAYVPANGVHLPRTSYWSSVQYVTRVYRLL